MTVYGCELTFELLKKSSQLFFSLSLCSSISWKEQDMCLNMLKYTVICNEKMVNTTICKLALTVYNFSCCFTFQIPGLVRQLPTKNNEARHSGAKACT